MITSGNDVWMELMCLHRPRMNAQETDGQKWLGKVRVHITGDPNHYSMRHWPAPDGDGKVYPEIRG